MELTIQRFNPLWWFLSKRNGQRGWYLCQKVDH